MKPHTKSCQICSFQSLIFIKFPKEPRAHIKVKIPPLFCPLAQVTDGAVTGEGSPFGCPGMAPLHGGLRGGRGEGARWCGSLRGKVCGPRASGGCHSADSQVCSHFHPLPCDSSPKSPPPMFEESPLVSSEKAMAPHSSTLAWKIPWTEEPGKLQSMGSLRVGHD